MLFGKGDFRLSHRRLAGQDFAVHRMTRASAKGMREYLVKLSVPRIGIIAVRVFATSHMQAREAAATEHPGSRVVSSAVVK